MQIYQCRNERDLSQESRPRCALFIDSIPQPSPELSFKYLTLSALSGETRNNESSGLGGPKTTQSLWVILWKRVCLETCYKYWFMCSLQNLFSSRSAWSQTLTWLPLWWKMTKAVPVPATHLLAVCWGVGRSQTHCLIENVHCFPLKNSLCSEREVNKQGLLLGE